MCKGKTKMICCVLCCVVVFVLDLVLLDYEYHATLQTLITQIGRDGAGKSEWILVGGTMGSQMGLSKQKGDSCFSQAGGGPRNWGFHSILWPHAARGCDFPAIPAVALLFLFRLGCSGIPRSVLLVLTQRRHLW